MVRPPRLTLTIACALTLLTLAACGGGSAVGTAADCFNPQLYAVGTSYAAMYQLSGSFGGTRTRTVSVLAGTSAGEVDVVTDTANAYVPPVPGGTIATRTRALQTVSGVDIVTSELFQSQSPFTMEMPTVYQPALRDTRYELAPGAQFRLVRNVVQASGTTSFATTVNYLGQESVTVPAGTFTACKFEERFDDGSVLDTWIARGSGVLAKSVGAGLTEELQALAGI